MERLRGVRLDNVLFRSSALRELCQSKCGEITHGKSDSCPSDTEAEMGSGEEERGRKRRPVVEHVAKRRGRGGK